MLINNISFKLNIFVVSISKKNVNTKNHYLPIHSSELGAPVDDRFSIP
jgi:hypothetical protein